MSAVILVTGGANRIGLAISEFLLEKGHHVIIHYRHSKKNAQSLVEKWGAERISLLEMDLLQDGWIPQLQNHLEGYDRLDGIVNNAAAFLRQPFSEWDVVDAEKLWRLNCAVPISILQVCQPWLEKSPIASVVNIIDNSSAERPWSNYASYAGSKSALMAMTKSLAKELAPQIRLNAVGPGVIQCEANESNLTQTLLNQIPMQRWGSSLEIAQTVEFLLFGPKYILGQLIIVDGGWGLH